MAKEVRDLRCHFVSSALLELTVTQGAARLTQDFFVRILERGWLEHADPNRGRFRSLLLSSAKLVERLPRLSLPVLRVSSRKD
jgi:hypothetical protein